MVLLSAFGLISRFVPRLLAAVHLRSLVFEPILRYLVLAPLFPLLILDSSLVRSFAEVLRSRSLG
jgi:hypothetical protein